MHKDGQDKVHDARGWFVTGFVTDPVVDQPTKKPTVTLITWAGIDCRHGLKIPAR